MVRANAQHAEAMRGQRKLARLVVDAAGGGAPAVQAIADIRDLLRPGNRRSIPSRRSNCRAW
jgi:hypothetical protein